MAEKVRTTVTMDASTKEQFDKFKEAGIDLNMSEILSSILKFDFDSIETFIDCMKKIHGQGRNYLHYRVRNGMLIAGATDKAQLTQYIMKEKLGRPELLEAVMMSKVRRNRTIPIEERLENLEKLVLRHNASINAIEDFVQKEETESKIETIKQVSEREE